MNDLATRTDDFQGILNLNTGEVVPLDAPLPDLARTLDAIRELESQLREQKAMLWRELHQRMDHSRVWTLSEDGWEVRGESDAPRVEWDGKKLYDALCALHQEGVIDEPAIAAAIEVVPVSFKPKLRGINNLLKSPEIAERLAGCHEVIPAEQRTRRVSVKRSGRKSERWSPED